MAVRVGFSHTSQGPARAQGAPAEDRRGVRRIPRHEHDGMTLMRRRFRHSIRSASLGLNGAEFRMHPSGPKLSLTTNCPKVTRSRPSGPESGVHGVQWRTAGDRAGAAAGASEGPATALGGFRPEGRGRTEVVVLCTLFDRRTGASRQKIEPASQTGSQRERDSGGRGDSERGSVSLGGPRSPGDRAGGRRWRAGPEGTQGGEGRRDRRGCGLVGRRGGW